MVNFISELPGGCFAFSVLPLPSTRIAAVAPPGRHDVTSTRRQLRGTQETTIEKCQTHPAKSSQNSPRKIVKANKNYLLKNSMWKRCASAGDVTGHSSFYHYCKPSVVITKPPRNSELQYSSWLSLHLKMLDLSCMNHIESTKWFPHKPTSKTLQ